MCEVWSGSHFILTVGTEKEMLVDARFRGGKLSPAQCHTVDVSKLGWEPHLSWECSLTPGSLTAGKSMVFSGPLE